MNAAETPSAEARGEGDGGAVPGPGSAPARDAAPDAGWARRPPGADRDHMHHLVASAAVVDEHGWTIDELARATGTTARTIRSYQDRGLLPPPVIVGRTGRYAGDHVARLRVISRLLDERFSLASIGALLHAWETGESLAHILGFVDDVAAHHDDTVALSSGHLPRVAPSELVAMGVPLQAVLDEIALLRQDCARIAARFVAMVDTHGEPTTDAPLAAAARAQVIDALPGEVAAVLAELLPVAHVADRGAGPDRHHAALPADAPRVDDRTNERALGAIDLTGNAVIADLTGDAPLDVTVEHPHTAR
jgi:DNA-binding transcriptional MerR regulator